MEGPAFLPMGKIWELIAGRLFQSGNPMEESDEIMAGKLAKNK
jgi:hypothetical protein